MAKSEKRLVKSKSGLRMISVDEKIASPFTKEEPPWVPDNSCSHCQNRDCQTKFELLKRKHHCRRCGKCFCDTCSNNIIALPRMCFIDPVRHCSSCFQVTKKENEFFDRHIKILLTGGQFRLYADENNTNPGKIFNCLLSSDHRNLTFEGDLDSQENIRIDKIEAVQVAAAETDQQGNLLGTGIAIKYMNSLGNVVTLKMEVENGSKRKQSMTWIASMLKAFKIVQDTKSQSSDP
ncbi:Zinc finger fyve domain-containing protein 21 [Plakobranchus ocellatus]|uniref:Zinc finger fyve domain-containing protein 21 n=1 Tax=Plakobranchus ocellatus TaxID=259542 RepID=A0AAV4CNR2_9GAST|nr:Zinc finger fyve domain-containing protein 21 [Plakobranchus ocellatus]